MMGVKGDGMAMAGKGQFEMIGRTLSKERQPTQITMIEGIYAQLDAWTDDLVKSYSRRMQGDVRSKKGVEVFSSIERTPASPSPMTYVSRFLVLGVWVSD